MKKMRIAIGILKILANTAFYTLLECQQYIIFGLGLMERKLWDFFSTICRIR